MVSPERSRRTKYEFVEIQDNYFCESIEVLCCIIPQCVNPTFKTKMLVKFFNPRFKQHNGCGFEDDGVEQFKFRRN